MFGLLIHRHNLLYLDLSGNVDVLALVCVCMSMCVAFHVCLFFSAALSVIGGLIYNVSVVSVLEQATFRKSRQLARLIRGPRSLPSAQGPRKRCLSLLV